MQRRTLATIVTEADERYRVTCRTRTNNRHKRRTYWLRGFDQQRKEWTDTERLQFDHTVRDAVVLEEGLTRLRTDYGAAISEVVYRDFSGQPLDTSVDQRLPAMTGELTVSLYDAEQDSFVLQDAPINHVDATATPVELLVGETPLPAPE